MNFSNVLKLLFLFCFFVFVVFPFFSLFKVFGSFLLCFCLVFLLSHLKLSKVFFFFLKKKIFVFFFLFSVFAFYIWFLFFVSFFHSFKVLSLKNMFAFLFVVTYFLCLNKLLATRRPRHLAQQGHLYARSCFFRLQRSLHKQRYMEHGSTHRSRPPAPPFSFQYFDGHILLCTHCRGQET